MHPTHRLICAQVGAHVEARYDNKWYPAIVDEVLEDGYEVEWVQEPEVFNRLDLEDVRAPRPFEPTCVACCQEREGDGFAHVAHTCAQLRPDFEDLRVPRAVRVPRARGRRRRRPAAAQAPAAPQGPDYDAAVASAFASPRIAGEQHGITTRTICEWIVNRVSEFKGMSATNGTLYKRVREVLNNGPEYCHGANLNLWRFVTAPDPPPGVDLNDPRVAEIRAMRARERAAAASDDAVQPVAAPAPAAAEEGNAMDVTE